MFFQAYGNYTIEHLIYPSKLLHAKESKDNYLDEFPGVKKVII